MKKLTDDQQVELTAVGVVVGTWFMAYIKLGDMMIDAAVFALAALGLFTLLRFVARRLL